MALCTLHYFSRAIGKMTGATVLMPEGADGPFPVFYLLHGLSDDHTAWTRNTNIERYVQNMPLIVVMPDGGRGFYTDAREGFAYGTATGPELISFIDRTFNTDARRQARVIGGLSMGGYGAIKLALTYPESYCSAVSHSGTLAVAHRSLQRESPELVRIFGANPRGGPDDLFALAERIDHRMLPALRFDCGVDDFLLEDNRSFHAHLKSLGIPHEYDELPGDHSWPYWDLQVQNALAFHARALGLHGATA
jgi:putative tributyrin esterase